MAGLQVISKREMSHIFRKHVNEQYLKKEPIDYEKLFEAFSEAYSKIPIMKPIEDITIANVFDHNSTIQSYSRIKVAKTTKLGIRSV